MTKSGELKWKEELGNSLVVQIMKNEQYQQKWSNTKDKGKYGTVVKHKKAMFYTQEILIIQFSLCCIVTI